MAPAFALLSVAIAAVCFLPPPVVVQACKSVGSNRTFADCSNLPYLSASLSWTYNHTTGTLSIGFAAPPVAAGGWVAWAINPTGKGMVGSQALAAFQGADGKMVVKTYNISSYGPIKESKIAFETADLAAESANGMISIFGTLTVGAHVRTVNQVWQSGASVTNGVPDKHPMDGGHLNSTGILTLTDSVSPAPARESSTGERNGSNLLYFFIFIFLLF